ncbi:MAG: hypothetical protein LBJ77_03115 [Holosporales bacterium]|nr:hypothetical protein [Holosporales bacterium]
MFSAAKKGILVILLAMSTVSWASDHDEDRRGENPNGNPIVPLGRINATLRAALEAMPWFSFEDPFRKVRQLFVSPYGFPVARASIRLIEQQKAATQPGIDYYTRYGMAARLPTDIDFGLLPSLEREDALRVCPYLGDQFFRDLPPQLKNFFHIITFDPNATPEQMQHLVQELTPFAIPNSPRQVTSFFLLERYYQERAIEHGLALRIFQRHFMWLRAQYEAGCRHYVRSQFRPESPFGQYLLEVLGETGSFAAPAVIACRRLMSLTPNYQPFHELSELARHAAELFHIRQDILEAQLTNLARSANHYQAQRPDPYSSRSRYFHGVPDNNFRYPGIQVRVDDVHQEHP